MPIIPNIRVELYKQGLAEVGANVFSSSAKQLSKLAQSLPKPSVVALDGDWGSGKTTFLRAWCKDFSDLEEGALTVYFDAFESDILDEPLLSLTEALVSRLPADSTDNGVVDRLKANAPQIGSSLFKATLAVGTGLIVRNSSEIVDDVARSFQGDLESISTRIFNEVVERKSSLTAFKSTISEFFEKSEQYNSIVFVVDELDRCRPDYALSVLEITKHVYDIPGVLFILGTNLKELETSVIHRYGSGSNAGKYLQRFYDIRMTLSKNDHQSSSSRIISYIDKTLDASTLNLGPYSAILEEVVTLLSRIKEPSFREVNHLLARLHVTPRHPPNSTSWRGGETEAKVIVILVALDTIFPKEFRRLLEPVIDHEGIASLISLKMNISGLDGVIESYADPLKYIAKNGLSEKNERRNAPSVAKLLEDYVYQTDVKL